MNIKNMLVLVAAAAIAALAVVVAISKKSSSALAPNQSKEMPAVSMAAPPKILPASSSAPATQRNQVKGTGGANRRAVQYLRAKHPELGITDEQEIAFQKIFDKNFDEFLAVRNKAVKTTLLGDGAIEVEIPADPDLGDLVMANFREDIRKHNGAADAKLEDALLDAFAGYTEQAGKNSVRYTLAQVRGSETQYSFTRTVLILDRKTGAVTGTGNSSGIIDMRNAPDPVLVTAVSTHKPQTP